MCKVREASATNKLENILSTNQTHADLLRLACVGGIDGKGYKFMVMLPLRLHQEENWQLCVFAEEWKLQLC